MKKIFNFRKPLTIAILFALSILIAYLSVSINYLFIFLAIVPCFAFLLSLFITRARLFIVKNIIFVALSILFFVFGIFSVLTLDYSYKKDAINVTSAHVEGKITSVTEADHYFVVNIDNANIDCSGKKYNPKHKLTFFISKDKGISTQNENDIISFDASVQGNAYILGGISNKANHVDNIVVVKDNKVSLPRAIKLKVKDNLESVMDETSAHLSYAMLFGESSIIDRDLYNEYSVSGIVHILAVSGLHVGFIISIFSMLFGLLKVRRQIAYIVMGILLILYSALCGFSSSVTRATIMAIILFYAKSRGKQYDSLNALAVAAMIILSVNPYTLFSKSFLLSFSSVFGIIVLSPIFNFYFSKILPSKMSNAISLSLGATIATYPFVIMYFKRISLLSLLTNFIVLPVATFAYMFLFIATILSLIVPVLKYIYMPIDYVYRFITIIVKSVASQTKLIVSFKTSILANSVFYTGLIIAGDLTLAKNKWIYYVPIFMITIAIILSIL